MSLQTFCYLLAVLGLILTGCGRTILISEAASVGSGWQFALRLLPLADLMFLARFWESAKVGSLLSLAGLICLMPLGAMTLYRQEHPKVTDAKEMIGNLNADAKNELYSSIKMEHDVRVRAKQRKLTQLNSHMAAWYSSMQNRRTALASATPEQVTQFNEEAAAYAVLLQMTKDEAAELQKLLSINLTGWNSISDEMYAEHLRKQNDRSRHVRISSKDAIGDGATKH